MAQKVTPAGALPWGAEARQVATIAFNPSAGDHTIVSSEDNTLAVWAAGDGSSDNIYIMRVEEVLHASVNFPEDENINVYPNPAGDHLHISLLGIKGLKEISMTDINGKIVEKISFSHQNKTADIINLSTASLPSGPYFLRITTTDLMMKQIVVIR